MIQKQTEEEYTRKFYEKYTILYITLHIKNDFHEHTLRDVYCIKKLPTPSSNLLDFMEYIHYDEYDYLTIERLHIGNVKNIYKLKRMITQYNEIFTHFPDYEVYRSCGLNEIGDFKDNLYNLLWINIEQHFVNDYDSINKDNYQIHSIRRLTERKKLLKLDIYKIERNEFIVNYFNHSKNVLYIYNVNSLTLTKPLLFML